MNDARTIRHELLAIASDIRTGIEAFRKACEKLDNLLQGEADNLSIVAANEASNPTIVGRYREAIKNSPIEPEGEAPKKKRPRKPMSEANRLKLAENLKKARAARKAKA